MDNRFSWLLRCKGLFMVAFTDVWIAPAAGFRAHLTAADRAEGTIETRMHQLARLAHAFPAGPRSVSELGLETWLASKRWASETRRSMRTFLRTFFAWATKYGYCITDPAENLPAVRRPGHGPRPVPDAVWKAARAAAEPRVQLMIDLAAQLGMRRAEIAAVHRNDVIQDLVGWSLVVHGKGRKDRILPLPDEIADRILEATDWVFPSDDPGHHLTPDRVGRLIKDAANGQWSAHQLRHRFATTVFGKTGDLLSTQQLMGHTSPATTQGYVLLGQDRLRAAAAAAVA